MDIIIGLIAIIGILIGLILIYAFPIILIVLIVYYITKEKRNTNKKPITPIKKTIDQDKNTTINKVTEPKQYLNYEYKKSESSNTNIDIYENKRSNSQELKQNDNPLLKKYLMTKSERIVFEKIKNNLNNKYVIFPQICMRSILSNNFTDRKNKSKWAIVDYLICTYPYYEPVLIIELDDPTHNEHTRRLKDMQLNILSETIELPIWRLRNIEDYSRFDTDIYIQIENMLKQYKISKNKIGY